MRPRLVDNAGRHRLRFDQRTVDRRPRAYDSGDWATEATIRQRRLLGVVPMAEGDEVASIVRPALALAEHVIDVDTRQRAARGRTDRLLGEDARAKLGPGV